MAELDAVRSPRSGRPRLLAGRRCWSSLAVAGALRRSMIEDVPPIRARRPRLQHDAVLFDRFSARRERSEDGDTAQRLAAPAHQRQRQPAVLRLRRRAQRAGRSRKLWAIWPPQAAGPGDHRQRPLPRRHADHRLSRSTLSDTWERVTATIPHSPDRTGAAGLRHRACRATSSTPERRAASCCHGPFSTS